MHKLIIIIKSKNYEYKFLAYIALSLYFLIISCNGPAKYPYDTKFQKVVFSDSTYQAVLQINPRVVNIYIDVSLSNKGFVSQLKSDFLQSIRELCSIVDPNTKINFYAFGTLIKYIDDKTKISLNYFQDEFNYYDTETRFDLLLDRINKSSNEEINLVFSDGIHSENKVTSNSYVELARLIRKYVKEGNLFGLIGNKGYFSGIYYPEVKTAPFQYTGMRPYYCFIFGSRRHIDFIKTHIIDNWKNYFLLYPTVISSIKADLNKSNMGIDESMAKNNTLILQNVSSVDTFKIPISVESDDFYFWDLSSIETTMQAKRVDIYYESDKDSMIIRKSENISSKTKIEVVKCDHQKLWLDINYVPEKVEGMSIYRLIITPKIPGWINNWSTDYDGDSYNVSKTYALKSFTHNLLKVTNDNQFALFSIYFVR